MALNARDRAAYRLDDRNDHKVLSREEKRGIVAKHLPAAPEEEEQAEEKEEIRKEGKMPRRPRFGVRRFLRHQLYVFTYTMMHAVFSLYIRTRQACHLVWYRLASIFFYHHRSPGLIQKDIRRLGRTPNHLSVILTAEGGGRSGGDLERLISEAAEIATWCACAGIPFLSVYERTGILKKYMPQLCRAVENKYLAYFGEQHPGLSISAPHVEDVLEVASRRPFAGHESLTLLLISYQDGRESMVDLTKTLAEMSQKAKLSPADINMDLVDAELSEGIMQEPDLLVIFGPHVELEGYPPWQVRLSEIFCLQDNHGVGYQVFLRALRNFSQAQFRKGK